MCLLLSFTFQALLSVWWEKDIGDFVKKKLLVQADLEWIF